MAEIFILGSVGSILTVGIIKYLLDLYNIDDDNELDNRLLVASQNIEEVNRLLLKYLSPDDYNFVLRKASKYGHIEVVNRLLEDPRVDPSTLNNLALSWASKYGHIEVVNRLLEDPRVDPSANDNLAILWATINNHIKIVSRLLDDIRVDANTHSNFIIKHMTAEGNIECLKKLLPRVNPNEYHNIIRLASQYGHLIVVNILLEDKRIDPSIDDNIAIRKASQNGHLTVVNRLLEDPRVYNDVLIQKDFKNELELLRELRIYRMKIIETHCIAEDLIYELCKYLHNDPNYYKEYMRQN
jgi:ankyrin repeat protein